MVSKQSGELEENRREERTKFSKQNEGFCRGLKSLKRVLNLERGLVRIRAEDFFTINAIKRRVSVFEASNLENQRCNKARSSCSRTRT